MWEDFPHQGKNSPDAHTRAAIGYLLKGASQGMLIDDSRMATLGRTNPKAAAELYLKTMVRKWPLIEKDRKTRDPEEVERTDREFLAWESKLRREGGVLSLRGVQNALIEILTSDDDFFKKHKEDVTTPAPLLEEWMKKSKK